ncbi:unnamed protein product [Nesidiocoris tenuis]|uniref:Uncharacterized protein n=1 Tax=Nesidiocoris tenuis TaxID=355587 RepID=A0A6H5HKB3_9HEMI|nr:unnamed protein product [Nesidiocoris tenuis]
MSEPTPGSSPKHSPITLRIYKDNLTVKTDLDSPKRNKSPMSTEFKSELSPHLRSESSSPQNKQLEFTLKIAKDANTNQPRATMSPKTASTSCASPSSVWKSEVQILDQPPASASDGPPLEDLETEPGRELALTPTRGRGRPRGRGRGRGGSRGRGGRRGSGRVLEQYTPTVIIKQEVISDQDDSTTGQSIDVQDMFLKMLSPELSSSTTAAATSAQTKPSSVHVDTPMPRKRGRPRKLAQPPLPIKEEMLATMIKLEPPDSSMMSDSGDNDTPSSETSTGRPKRTCRGRTKPIVVKKRRGRGGGVAASGGIPRRPSTPLPNETSSPATSDLPRSSISLSPPKMIASSEVSPAGMIEKANQEAGNMENLPASSTSVPTTPNADPTEPNTPLAVPLGSPDDETPSAALLREFNSCFYHTLVLTFRTTRGILYTSNELMYFPINTVIYGPLKPNERQKDGSEEGSNSDSSSSSSSCSSSAPNARTPMSRTRSCAASCATEECYGVKYGLQNKLSSSSSIHCDYCVERIHSSSQGSSLIKV